MFESGLRTYPLNTSLMYHSTSPYGTSIDLSAEHKQNTEQPVDNPASIHHLRHLYVHSLVWSNRSFIKTFMMGHIVCVSVG